MNKYKQQQPELTGQFTAKSFTSIHSLFLQEPQQKIQCWIVKNSSPLQIHFWHLKTAFGSLKKPTTPPSSWNPHTKNHLFPPYGSTSSGQSIQLPAHLCTPTAKLGVGDVAEVGCRWTEVGWILQLQMGKGALRFWAAAHPDSGADQKRQGWIRALEEKEGSRVSSF